MTTDGSTPPIDAWQVVAMRFTAFPHDVVPAERLSWWDDIVGLPPETVVSRRKMAQYQAQGDFEGRPLALQIQPGRIEWNVSSRPKADEEASLPPPLGPFSEVLASLSKIVMPWLPVAPALTRVAFGAILLQPVSNKHSGYTLIKKYLPGVAIDADGSSDLLYQINRPRPSMSGVPDLRMNRLMKWSVQLGRAVIMTIGADGVITRTLDEEVAGRLELDVNTAPAFAGTLPGERLSALFEEMVALAREIAQKGDVP